MPSERVALTGSNGSGKTTLLWAIVGLTTAQHGTVQLFGQQRSTEQEFQAIRGRVGLLFQDADDQLFCPTVAEDIAFGPLNQGHTPDRAREIVADTLAQLGLDGFGPRITYQLSGGEKRLVALAAVLAMRPEILMLDEPTAGLDDDAVLRVAKLLEQLPQSMLIVSHDHDFLDELTTRRVELRDGRLV